MAQRGEIEQLEIKNLESEFEVKRLREENLYYKKMVAAHRLPTFSEIEDSKHSEVKKLRTENFDYKTMVSLRFDEQALLYTVMNSPIVRLRLSVIQITGEPKENFPYDQSLRVDIQVANGPIWTSNLLVRQDFSSKTFVSSNELKLDIDEIEIGFKI